MTSEMTIEAIAAHLDEQPTDWVARLQLADLLEDAGRMDEAKMQRQIVVWKDAPRRIIDDLGSTWCWVSGVHYGTRREAEDCMMQFFVGRDWFNA